MSAFEYASGLISIVTGLAVARVLSGISTFIAADERNGSDWIVASWCFALLLNLVSWWLVCWYALHERAEIEFVALFGWILATSPLYAAAHVLVPDTLRGPGETRARLQPLRGAFYLCLATQFLLGSAVTLTTGPALDPDTSPLLGLTFVAAMIAASAAGVFVRSNRARALHLLIWLALFALLAGIIPAIG